MDNCMPVVAPRVFSKALQQHQSSGASGYNGNESDIRWQPKLSCGLLVACISMCHSAPCDKVLTIAG